MFLSLLGTTTYAMLVSKQKRRSISHRYHSQHRSVRHIPERIDPAIKSRSKIGAGAHFDNAVQTRIYEQNSMPKRATIDTKYGPNNFVSATAKLNKPRPFSGERACPVCVGKEIGEVKKAAMRASVFRISRVTIWEVHLHHDDVAFAPSTP